MITYAALANKPRLLQNFTGLTPAAFTMLLPIFSQAYTQARRDPDAQRLTPRQRQPGAGRPATLGTAADKLLYIRFYFKF